ncbi:MAG: nucleotidyltransferase domain-containing protein [Peptococcaceae bacterium]|nr:nucleotidyltransferase domain-containing protein [Peptococcaceae bacterium]
MTVQFGSRATGKDRPDSDWDLGILVDDKVHGKNFSSGYHYYTSLFAELAEQLKSGNLQLVFLHRASPLLQFEAASTGRPIYQDEEGAFTRFSVMAAKKHWDCAPLYKMEEKYLMSTANQRGYHHFRTGRRTGSCHR